MGVLDGRCRMANQAPEGMKGAFQGVHRVFESDREGREALRGGQGDRPRPDLGRGSRAHARPHGLHALVRPGKADDHVRHHKPPCPVRPQSGLVGNLRHGRGAGPPHAPPHARHGRFRAGAGVLLPRALPGHRAHRQGRNGSVSCRSNGARPSSEARSLGDAAPLRRLPSATPYRQRDRFHRGKVYRRDVGAPCYASASVENPDRAEVSGAWLAVSTGLRSWPARRPTRRRPCRL